MFSQLFQDREIEVKRLLAIAAVVVVLAGTLSAAGAGVALAQSEEEEDSRTGGVTVPAAGEDSDDNSSANESASTSSNSSNGGGSGTGEQTPTDVRAESQNEAVDGGNESDSNESATDTRANSQVPEGTDDGSDVRDSDDDGGVGFVAQRMLDMIDGLTTQASNEFGEAVSRLFELASSRSAPGIADQPDTWESPGDDQPMWQGSTDVTELTAFMGWAIVLFGYLYSAMEWFRNPASAKRRLKWCFIATAYLIDPHFWNGASLHFSNTVSSTILPNGEAFATPEGMLLVGGLTILLGALLAGAGIWIIALATFVTAISYAAGFMTSSFLPLAISFYVLSMYMRSLGKMMVYLHGVTVVMPIFQALAVLAVSRMALSATGAVGTLSGVLMYLGVVYLVFYMLQKEVLEKAFDAPITSLGVHGAQMSLDGARNVSSTVTNAPQMFKDMKANIETNIEATKSRFSGSDGGFSRPSIGALQPQSLTRRGGAVADGGSDGMSSPSRRGADATSNSFPPSGGRGFQATDVETNRERDRMAHGDY